MAYLQEMSTQCDRPGCNSRAMVQLKDWRNEYRGKWCRRHGGQQLRRREKYEKANPTHRP